MRGEHPLFESVRQAEKDPKSEQKSEWEVLRAGSNWFRFRPTARTWLPTKTSWIAIRRGAARVAGGLRSIRTRASFHFTPALAAASGSIALRDLAAAT